MAELFADLPEALENSVEIARRCNARLELGKNYLPDFPVPDGHGRATPSSARGPRRAGAAVRALSIPPIAISREAADPTRAARFRAGPSSRWASPAIS
jgi:DNA polymerase-3 subunit alpha